MSAAVHICFMEGCGRIAVRHSYVFKQADAQSCHPYLCESCYQITSRMCKADSSVTLHRHFRKGLITFDTHGRQIKRNVDPTDVVEAAADGIAMSTLASSCLESVKHIPILEFCRAPSAAPSVTANAIRICSTDTKSMDGTICASVAVATKKFASLSVVRDVT